MSCSKQCFDKDDPYYGHDDCSTCPGRDDGQKQEKPDDDVGEEMTIGIDCCPHGVPYGSECFECDEDEADAAMGLTVPNACGKATETA